MSKRKKPVGRPKMKPAELKSKAFLLRMKQKDYVKLKKYAKTAGNSVAEQVRIFIEECLV